MCNNEIILFKNKSKKRKNVVIVIILVISILIVNLYMKTDILKSKEQLFWKYFLEEIKKTTNIFSNERVKIYNRYLKNSYYIKDSEFSISSKYGFIKPINVEVSEKGDNIKKITNTNIELKYNNKNIQNSSIIKDNDYFIIKNDYLTTDYIGFENKNLKQLAQKFGIENTNFIPNQIRQINLIELFSITKEEKNHILKEYVPIFKKIIRNKNYSKTINYKDDEKCQIISYKIDISEEEAKELIIKILKKLYNDETSLRFISQKIKLLNGEDKYCDINYIKEKINGMITEFELKETKGKEFISIIINKDEKNVIKTELVLKNNRTISIQIDNNQNNIIIKQSDVKNKEINFQGIGNIINTILDSISEITYSTNINNNKNKVCVDIMFNLGIEKIKFNYNYVIQIKNNVENILEKKDIKYTDVEKIDKELYRNIFEKVHKISTLLSGKKY